MQITGTYRIYLHAMVAIDYIGIHNTESEVNVFYLPLKTHIKKSAAYVLVHQEILVKFKLISS